MSRFLTVRQTAEYLNVSESWVRRHLAELPAQRLGRKVLIDSSQIQSMMAGGKPLIPESRNPVVNRYQQGYVKLEGARKHAWYGYFREDTPSGRQQRHVRLGTVKELPTKAAARRKLKEMMDGAAPPPKSSVSFRELAKRWTDSEGTALGTTTLGHYTDALRAYVLPQWSDRKIDTINREAVQQFLKKQAPRYSRSSLKSMRLVIKMVLSWAERNGDIERPNGWLEGLRLPKKCGGRKVVRTVLTPEQSWGIIRRLKEPYQTLALFIALTGKRIEEAIGVQPDDLDSNNILHIRRIIYDGRVEELEREQIVPLDSPEHEMLVRRLRALGEGHKWVFHSRKDTPVSPGNARRRYLQPAAKAVGVTIGGWHDFRHTVSTTLRKSGVHPVVVSGALAQKKVELAPEVYDRATVDDLRAALSVMGNHLLRDCYVNKDNQP